ncbi:MAG: DUF2157 domain-containing protein [Hyphomicrobium sp.]
MWGSRKRLTDDINRWRAAGWVTSEGEEHILREIASAKRGVGLASVLGILASVLLGFAAISFVAAHWQDMPRLSRLALLFSLIGGGYGVAGLFAWRGQRLFSDAAILFAVIAFGASIALISQMFHIDGNPPDGVLLWMLGAIVAGVALQSHPALALAMVLAALWAGMQSGQSGAVHWPFLVAWTAVTAAFVWQQWRPGMHIAGVALSGFIITLGYLLDTGYRHELVAVTGVAGTALAIAASKLRPDTEAIAAPVLGYAIAVAFAGMFALQFWGFTSSGELMFLAAVTLAFLLAAIWYGVTMQHRGAVWLGYIGFSIEILALYWKTVGTILDTSLFFLVAGLIVAGLAFMAWRLAMRSTPQEVTL